MDGVLELIKDERFIWGVIGAVIGVVISYILKDLILDNITKLMKFIFIKSFKYISSKIAQLKSRYIKWKNKREYYKTIKLIENGKIDIPKNFFMGKSKKRNPELKRIYEMIENGELERPELFLTDEELEKLQKAFKNNVYKQPQVPTLSKDIPKVNPRDFNDKE